MESIVTLILSYLGFGGIVLIIAVKYYNNIRNFSTDIMSFIAATFGWFKSSRTKKSIEINGTTSINKLNRIVPELNLPELSVKWVKSDSQGKVRLEPGKAIVLLKYNQDNTQNIINTTSIYIQNTLLLNSKPYLDKGIIKAIDFAVIRAFLSKTPQKDYIVSQYINTYNEDIDRYEDAFNKVLRVEDEGLFTRVLLREYAIWGNKIVGRVRDSSLVGDSSDFLTFIYNIASRDFDELTPLAFNSVTLKVAVLLVARLDTYSEKGVKPYLRRIREGFANGINTFYLLARNEKIDILEKVYSELISTGNYNLLNGPEVYKDFLGRNNICYCIEVKSDADMAKSYAAINNSIKEESSIECSITSVYTDNIIGDYNGLQIIINRKEITDNVQLRLKSYYTPGMTLEVNPLRIIEGGKVYASVLNTSSNPNLLFNNNFSVGKRVTCIVQSSDDLFITLLVKDTNQKCIAYRRNLTYSRFAFLHVLFPIGYEADFYIKEIDYINNCLELKYVDLVNPWENIEYHVDDEVNIQILAKTETCIETELANGLFAILPNSEISWFDDIDGVKKSFKRNNWVKVRIKKIDLQHKIIILSYKDKTSPYISFYEGLPDDKNAICKIELINTYGVLGLIDSKYKVFIPFSETYIGKNNYKIQTGKSYAVNIKEIDKRGTSLIGSFKPFIKPPLAEFNKEFKEGQILSRLKMIKVADEGVYFLIRTKRKKSVEALLLKSEISNNYFVQNLDLFFDGSYSCPLVLKKIDLDKNVVYLSLKALTDLNEYRIETVKFGDVLKGRVLAKHFNSYAVMIENLWVEVSIKSSRVLKVGDTIEILKESSSSFVEAN